jgi:hypothetical protein
MQFIQDPLLQAPIVIMGIRCVLCDLRVVVRVLVIRVFETTILVKANKTTNEQ